MNLYEGHSITRRTLLLGLLFSVQFTTFAHAGYILSIPVEKRVFDVPESESGESTDEEYVGE